MKLTHEEFVKFVRYVSPNQPEPKVCYSENTNIGFFKHGERVKCKEHDTK